MKKAICLLLALLLLLTLTACGASGRREADEDDRPAERHTSRRSDASAHREESAAEPAPAETETPPAPTEKPVRPREAVDVKTLPVEIYPLLERFGWFGRSDAQSFTGSEEDAVRLMRYGFELIVGYDAYPGPDSVFRAEPDPLGRWDSCEVYDAEKAEGILRTVYHFSDGAIRAIRESGEEENAGYYYLDGCYFISPMGVGGGSLVCPLYAESNGVDLYLYYAVYNGDVFYYNGGLQYAVLSEAELDGESCWTLESWSRELPVIDPPAADAGSAIGGDWILEADGLSSLQISDYDSGAFQLYLGFYRLFGMEAEAKLIKGGEIALFCATDGTGYMGRIDVGADALTLILYDSPSLLGYEGFDERFNGLSYRFVRQSAAAAPAEESFRITPEELEQEIERIRAVYYTPSDGDAHLTIPNGTDNWNYSREYYFHNDQLVFAFIYNNLEEHRLYFKDGHMIRYIDENHQVYDFGALDPFESWARRALEEAALSYIPLSVEPSAWLGTWYGENGEWIRVDAADENGLRFTYHHNTEQSMMDTEYELPFLSAAKNYVAEDESLIANGGWRYCFYLVDDHIVVTSRYPDRLFYK